MKFVAENVSKRNPRQGTISDIEKQPNLSIKTPMAMLYTRGGSLPHQTYEIAKLVSREPSVIQIPLVSTYQFKDVMAMYPGTISDFVGLKNYVTCVTVQDPGDLTTSGYHSKDGIPIWTRSGKKIINPDCYMDAVEAFKPDMYFLLSDGDTNAGSSSKRADKSVNNTVNFFHKCLERHKKSDILKKAFVMACISGGYSLKARERCIQAILESDDVRGFLIDGLHNNGPEVELLPYDDVKTVLEFVMDKLPSEKMRVVHGCWNPVVVLKMVQLGVDIFDTSYCYIVTERSAALTFSVDTVSENQQYEINLRNEKYIDDFGPILSGCKCLACVKYTRSYVHHLIVVQELLGPVLLSIHNTHHYQCFFEKIRYHIQEGTLNQLQDAINKQFEDYIQKLTCNNPNRNDFNV